MIPMMIATMMFGINVTPIGFLIWTPVFIIGILIVYCMSF